jgi:hypothetical protein
MCRMEKKSRGRSATDLILDTKTCSSEKDDAELRVANARSRFRCKEQHEVQKHSESKCPRSCGCSDPENIHFTPIFIWKYSTT